MSAGGPPLEKVAWGGLYCPFRKVRATAEFVYAESSRRGGARVPLTRSRTYRAERYAPAAEVETLTLSSSDYLVFSHDARSRSAASPDGAGKAVLSYPHMARFQDGLAEVLQWIAGGKHFAREPGTALFRLLDPGSEQVYKIEDLHAGASIGFLPVVLSARGEEEGGELGACGVRMLLNSTAHHSDATVEEFAAFERFHQNFDLFATCRAAMVVAAGRGAVAAASEWGASAPQPQRRRE